MNQRDKESRVHAGNDEWPVRRLCGAGVGGSHRDMRLKGRPRPGQGRPCAPERAEMLLFRQQKLQMPEEGCQEQGCQQQAGEKAKCSDDYRAIQTAAARGVDGRQ